MQNRERTTDRELGPWVRLLQSGDYPRKPPPPTSPSSRRPRRSTQAAVAAGAGFNVLRSAMDASRPKGCHTESAPLSGSASSDDLKEFVHVQEASLGCYAKHLRELVISEVSI